MALGDTLVENAQIFGNRCDGGLAFCEGRVQIFFLGGVLRVQCLTFGGDGLLRFLESGFRGFQAALGIFSAHHGFELAVFSFGDFGFGVGDFVLKCFVGFVGFNCPALFAVFLGALFPLLDVELEFLALGKAVGVGFSGGGDGVACAGQFQVGLLDTLGESFYLGAQGGDVLVDDLQVEKARNCWMHLTKVYHSGAFGGAYGLSAASYPIGAAGILTNDYFRKRASKLPPIISAQGLSKRYGVEPLFRDISFTVSEGARIGIIGPNGSGKSTLLEMLNGRVQPDSGDVAIRKGTQVRCVLQISEFAPGETIRTVIDKALDQAKVAESERLKRIAEILGRAGFTDLDAEPATLSGGWRKRLAIVEALVQKPDILLLDEPTNHLDLAGIKWLETLLQSATFASVIVSHDRYFLENVANEIVELNPAYEDGALRVSGNYSAFLEAKEFICTRSATGKR